MTYKPQEWRDGDASAPAGATIPAGEKVNPPVPSENEYTFTEMV